jgi:hypothetical protein
MQTALVATLMISNSQRLNTFWDVLYCASFCSMRPGRSRECLSCMDDRYDGGGGRVESSLTDEKYGDCSCASERGDSVPRRCGIRRMFQ